MSKRQRRALKEVAELEEVVDANRREWLLKAELESWSTKTRVCEEELDVLQSRAVVDMKIHGRCITEKEHWRPSQKNRPTSWTLSDLHEAERPMVSAIASQQRSSKAGE